ncbi:MobV family relaxase [Staphylococcus aureus]|uniref:MobV family relaxase n=4 Tax=Staphylococcus aureus TaxID=1280 RepID=UPI000DE3FCB3|nr:MobV family relaxase [Staphylococcus aureus]MBU8217674.1 plasmid recombination protein [Staphylococcus aureus]MBU8220269.1 plasmid recombination protein [Staphylococcus aureus]MBU8225585.1 plasmid recombination protein [Staphylococcus aureus]MBV2989784.1 plasmid recombination protein [Staphylococcus aureus]MBX7833615.1 plasmid recombination protein [Staphylococcus aureus]
MSYSIIRVEKIKSSVNTTGIQKHVQRENANYSNEDIQQELTQENYDLVNEEPINFNDEIEKKIEERYTVNRAIRKDAVKHVDGIVTTDKDYFDNLTLEQTRDYFNDSLDFIKDEYGEENILYATVHMDEATPHMHFGFVPITNDGRLSAKQMLGNKKAFTDFQNRYNEHMNRRGYKLERGKSKHITGAKHEEMNAYKQKTNYHKQEMERQQKEVESLKDKKQNIEKEMNKQIASSKAHIDDLQGKYKELGEMYQKDKERLEKPLNVEYEKETKIEGGLFNREEVQTGNVVLKESDFNELLEQSKSANRILERYEDLNNGTEIAKLRNEIDDLKQNLDKAVEFHEEDEQEIKQLSSENKRLKNENQSLRTENKKQVEVINGVKDAFYNTMNVFEKVLGKERFKNCVLKVDKMLNSNQTFRNLVVGFDDKYKEVFMRNDKLNLAKEHMYVSQDISIKDMDKQIIESELETSEGFLSIEIDLSDEDFKAYLEEPEKYIVALPVTMDEESIFVSLEDIELDKPLEFDKDLGLGESHELDMEFDLELER